MGSGSRVAPRYPIYIPSKGRADRLYTARMFDADSVPYRVVVQPDQVDAYEPVVGADRLLVLPENDRGLVYARNWITDHARAAGVERHWQFDDDVMQIMRIHRKLRLPMHAGVALRASEDFCDRYTNVKLASFNSEFFIPMSGTGTHPYPPFYLNQRCYTLMLMSCDLPLRWRGTYNEDTDMSLQVLAGGWCTILFNAFVIRTPATMTHKGGQTDIYVNDGRLRMSRELERRWPYVVETTRRFGRPQHKVHSHWKKFDTRLIRRDDVDIPEGDPYGLALRPMRDDISDSRLNRLIEEEQP